MARLPHPLPTALLAAALAGCAAPGPYPSLAQREAERQLAAGDEERQATIPADDDAFEQRVDALLTEGRAGWTAFEQALPGTVQTVQRAGPGGSDGWVEAQQAISRLHTTGAGTYNAIGDLDQLMLEQANAGRLGPADRERADAALAELQRYADMQRSQLQRLEGMLSPP